VYVSGFAKPFETVSATQYGLAFEIRYALGFGSQSGMESEKPCVWAFAILCGSVFVTPCESVSATVLLMVSD